MSVSLVQPVAILSAVFWVVCSFPMFVSDIIGDQMVLAYSMTGRTAVLKVDRRVSFCSPQDVAERALRILVEFSAFTLVIAAWASKLSFGSKVRPRILGFFSVGMMMLLMDRFSVV